MKGKASPARLLIVDDHALVREGMRTMLAKEPDLEVVGEATNGQEALELCRQLRPDLVLMDVRMPKMDGLEATRAIKSEYPTISVLIVTVQDSPDYLLTAIRAGAAGYVLKDATKQRLLNSVRRVLAGESPLNQELAMRLLQHLAEEADRETKHPTPGPAKKPRKETFPEAPAEPLTTRELQVLRVLAQGKTNREVARDLRVSLSKDLRTPHHQQARGLRPYPGGRSGRRTRPAARTRIEAIVAPLLAPHSLIALGIDHLIDKIHKDS